MASHLCSSHGHLNTKTGLAAPWGQMRPEHPQPCDSGFKFPDIDLGHSFHATLTTPSWTWLPRARWCVGCRVVGAAKTEWAPRRDRSFPLRVRIVSQLLQWNQRSLRQKRPQREFWAGVASHTNSEPTPGRIKATRDRGLPSFSLVMRRVQDTSP